MLKWFYNTDSADGKSGAELDAQLAELNRRKLEEGSWTLTQYQQAEANRERGIVDVDKELSEAFNEGLAEGTANVRGTIGGTINQTIGNALKIIPWQVWIGAALFAFFYLGGLKFLKGAK